MHKVVTYIFFAIVLVMIATHASGFATAVTAVGGQATNETSLFDGLGVSREGDELMAASKSPLVSLVATLVVVFLVVFIGGKAWNKAK